MKRRHSEIEGSITQKEKYRLKLRGMEAEIAKKTAERESLETSVANLQTETNSKEMEIKRLTESLAAAEKAYAALYSERKSKKTR